jgi:hypothetical protein
MLEREAEGDYAAVQHDTFHEGHNWHAFNSTEAYPDVLYSTGRRSSRPEVSQALSCSGSFASGGGGHAWSRRNPQRGPHGFRTSPLLRDCGDASGDRLPPARSGQRGRRDTQFPDFTAGQSPIRRSRPESSRLSDNAQVSAASFQVSPAVSLLAARMAASVARPSREGAACTGRGFSSAGINLLTLDY